MAMTTNSSTSVNPRRLGEFAIAYSSARCISGPLRPAPAGHFTRGEGGRVGFGRFCICKRYAASKCAKNREKRDVDRRMGAAGGEIVATSGQRLVTWMSMLAVLELAHRPAGVVADFWIAIV